MDVTTLSQQEALLRLLRWMGVKDTQHVVVPEHWQRLLPDQNPPADAPKEREKLFDLLKQINDRYQNIPTADIQFAAALFKQANPDHTDC